MLEELGLDYEVARYQRDPETLLAPPALRAVHPLGKSPVITEDDVTIVESGAIVEYLVERGGAGRLIPVAGTPERLRYTYWLHYAEGSAMPPLLLSLIFARIPKQPMPFFARPIARGIAVKVRGAYIDPQLRQHFDYVENELGKSTWFAGEAFSAADIQMSFPMEAAAARGVIGVGQPHSSKWLQRIHARAAYQRALERGGPYDLLH